jgi:hypothetical protein
VLHELTAGYPAFEISGTQEVVVDAVGLSAPRNASGGRDGQLKPGNALEQPCDEGSLADP